MADNVVIWSVNHHYDGEDLKCLPYDDVLIPKPVIIEDNVWICEGAKIVPGVTIGEGAIIGMGAVVVNDVPKFAVVGGNPARVLKYRNPDVYERLKNENRFIRIQKEYRIKLSKDY